MRGYRRPDGLFEIEGHLVDTKAESFTRPLAQQPTPAGQALHDLWVRLVVDEWLTIHDVMASSDVTPYAVCPQATAALSVLKGATIGPGWARLVNERLPRVARCTHLAEMLIPMATTAMQTMTPISRLRPVKTDANGRPLKVDSCYAYASHRDPVRLMFPDFHTPAPGPAPSA